MNPFHGIPVFRRERTGDGNPHLLVSDHGRIDASTINDGIAQGELVLVRGTAFPDAVALFGALVDRHGLRDSYDAQMQWVVSLMSARDPVDQVAVTVNKRAAYEVIQPHSEGDSTSPLDLFALYCLQNADTGGENVLSLIDQEADHSALSAKEKAIVDEGLSPSELNRLRRDHLDARDVIPPGSPVCRVLRQTPHGRVVVRHVPLAASTSVVSGEKLVTYWDNVTVHDHAFHRHHHQLLSHLGIFNARPEADDYRAYMHVEEDSPWGPADTDSGGLEATARLFRCHVVYKMEPGDFLAFNNRAWTHAANNWPPHQARTLYAMYA